MRIFTVTMATMASVFTINSALAQTSSSDEHKMEEVLVTGELSRYGATKSTTPVFETVRSVSIETEKMFRDKGALTLDDALNYTSGVTGDSFGFSTRGDFPKVRGFDAAEYRDGSQVLFGFYNNTRSDVYMLEQVEVLKGPASGLYGKGTPGGIVNATSKLAGPNKNNEVIVDVGTFNRQQAALDLNHSFGDSLHLRVVGLYRDSDTQVDYVEDDAKIIMPSITYQTEKTQLTAMVEVVDRDSDTSHQFLPLTGTACVSDDVSITPNTVCANATGETIESSTYLGDPEFNRYDTDSVLVSMLGAHQFNEVFSLEGTARFKDGEADYRQTWIGFMGTGNPRVDESGDSFQTSWYQSDASSEQQAFDLRARFEFSTGPFEHDVLVGLASQKVALDNDTMFQYSLQPHNVYSPIYSEMEPPFNPNDALADAPESISRDGGIYINDQVSIGQARINLGLRRDKTEVKSEGQPLAKDFATTGNIGVLYIFDSGVSPYLSYAESFEPVLGTDGLTNTPLKPREGEQKEAGVKYNPAATKTFVTFAYFEIEESNLPNPASIIGQPDGQQEGIGKVDGFEVEAQSTLGNWYVEGNISVLDTQTPDGERFDSIPEEQASAWVQYAPISGPMANMRIGVGLRYAGDNQSNTVDDPSSPDADESMRVVSDGYLLADLLIGYSWQDWDISLNVRNINDESYYGTCLTRGDCFPGEQRTAVLRAAKTF